MIIREEGYDRIQIQQKKVLENNNKLQQTNMTKHKKHRGAEKINDRQPYRTARS